MRQYTPSKNNEALLERLTTALEHIDKSSKGVRSPMLEKTERMQQSLISELRKAVITSDRTKGNTSYTQQTKTFVDAVKSIPMRVSLINAGRDIVDPLSDQIRKNLLDHHDFLSNIQTEKASYMTRMIHSINALNKETEGANRGLILAFRQFMRHPVWMTLNFIGNALKTTLTTTASALWTLAFGKKDKTLTVEEKILQAIKDQTEFFMKGSIDKTKSFWDRLTSGGLIGAPIAAIGRGLLSGIGISQSTAQQRELEKSQGKTNIKGGLWGKLSDFMYGGEIQKFGRQGGLLSQSSSQCETKDCRRKTKPEYTYDVNLVELPNLMRALFEDQGELVKHQINGEAQYFKVFKDYIDVVERIERDTTDTVHELKKQNRRSFLGLIMSGITGLIASVGSIASAIIGAGGAITKSLIPLASILTAGFVMMAKAAKEAGMKSLLLAKAGWDFAKDLYQTIFKKKDGGACIPSCGGASGSTPGDSKDKDGKDKKPSKWGDAATKGKAALATILPFLFSAPVALPKLMLSSPDAGVGSDFGLSDSKKTPEQREYELLMAKKRSWFHVEDVLGAKEKRLKEAADAANEAARKQLDHTRPDVFNKPVESVTIVDELKNLVTGDEEQTKYLKEMSDALEQLKQITLDPQAYMDKYKSITGAVNSLGINSGSGVNFGRTPKPSSEFRSKMFRVDPGAFGQAADLPEAMVIPDQPMNVTVPEANVPIPPQSSIGDSKVVQLLSSIDSKLNNLGQSQTDSFSGFGNDSNTILNIYGGVA